MEFDELVRMCTSGAGSGSDQGGGAGQDGGRPGELPGERAMLEKNLAALALRNPVEARLIGEAPVRGDLKFIETQEGLSVELGGVALGSKRRPLSEACKLAATVDPERVACAAVVGFAMGYHCRELLTRLGTCSIVVCFEPDLGLLRGVLSRIDCTELFGSGRFYLVTDAYDAGRINAIFTGSEALVGMGVELVVHPPSATRLSGLSDAFGKNFSDVLRSARTHVVTTLANARVSFRNALMNLDHYTRSAGIASLAGVCAGRAAIVVSAGPSLQRNLELLGDPSVRDSFVIIAVQTVLKPMLARGIKPHFVAALDYHEVSKRFYEGLTERDVRGVRLLAEAKANPAILDAFPGEVLCPREVLLDTMLGEKLRREMGELPSGATVAHLCYYFARYLGCDPVILMGQDLGFTDGQYYAAGAAIHDVWGSELSAHRTLEMFEWERIVRMRSNLRKKTDIHGNPIYSDEQMSAYLAQFESDFARDTAAGLTVIDASEGGVRKAHTTVMTLREAIDAHRRHGVVAIPETHALAISDERTEKRVSERLARMIDDCTRISEGSARSIGLLESMLKHQKDQGRVNTLIKEVNAVRDRVMKMEDAFRLVEFINQVGVLNRMKRDRAIGLGDPDDPYERQRRQIERDITNVQWTKDAAEAVGCLLRQGNEALLGRAPKQTNEMREVQDGPDPSAVPVTEIEGGTPVCGRDRVHALVIADPVMTGLGTKRDDVGGLGTVLGAGINVLQMTLLRLDRCEQLDAITIITPEAGKLSSLLGSLRTRLPMSVVEVDPAPFRAHARRVGAARVQSSECWRGSIGMHCVYDEQAHPGLLAQVMREHEIDAGAIVGADWAMIDPELVDETITRLRCQQADKRIAFSQAVPGIGTMVVDRATMCSLGESLHKQGVRNHFSTLGALLSYIPAAPQSDPIIKALCVQIDPALRDAGVRVIADTPARVNAIRDAYASIGVTMDNAVGTGAIECVDAFGETYKRYGKICPRSIVLETCTGRLVGGDWGTWKRRSIEPIERQVLSLGDAHKILGEIRSLRDDVAVIFDGTGDPLMHPEALGLVALAREDGCACVELRTDLMREGVDAVDLIESGIDILSVDVLADSAQTYAKLTGNDAYERLYARLQALFDARRANPDCPVHLAARITRCDLVSNEIEAFYDKWLMLTGCAIIDPLPGFVKNQRITALPLPAKRREQLDRSTMRIQCDGVVVDRDGKPIVSQGSTINAIDEGVGQAYQRMCSAMRAAQIEMKIRADEYAA